MAGQRIAFDARQFDQLLAQVQALLTDLQKSLQPGAEIAIGPEMELQPEPQQWNVSADMVAAGRTFGSAAAVIGDTLITELEELQSGLVAAKSVFERATDLASLSASEWADEFPELQSGTA